MKRIWMILGMFVVFAASQVFAQTAPQTKDEWQQAMKSATDERDAAKKQVEGLESDIAALKTKDASLTADLKKCQDALVAAAGETAEQEHQFYVLLDSIDARTNELARLSNQDLLQRSGELDLINGMIARARSNKLALIPRNKARLDTAADRLSSLRQSLAIAEERKEQVYTVGTWARNRDCLWNIAKKPSIYADPFLWPKIWQENRAEIRNPDLLHRGQKLLIPAKSSLTLAEKKAEATYWRHKRLGSPSSPK